MPRVPLRIIVGGRTYTTEINAKSLRRCIAAIGAAEPGGVAVVLQGRLEGDTIVDAGIGAQPKAAEVAE